MSVKVLHAGLALPQDLGRDGYKNVGVAAAGCFDPYSYRLLGNLMGYSEGSYPAIELLAGSISLRTEDELILGTTGAASLDINGEAAPVGVVLPVPAGSTIYFSVSDSGPAYLTFNGLSFPKVLESVSYDSMSGIGNTPLRAGDIIESEAPSSKSHVGRFVKSKGYWERSFNGRLRVVPGPQEGLEALLASEWDVHSSARSGVRLSARGAGSVFSGSANLKSFPTLFGAVQIPPSGNPIILGPDSGVTGGYPIVATVISADLSRISRLQQGSSVRFEAVSLAIAQGLYHEWERSITTNVVRVEHIF